MNRKHQQSIYHFNANLIKESVIQINGVIMINVYVNVKNMCVKKIMFEIRLHIIVKMENI